LIKRQKITKLFVLIEDGVPAMICSCSCAVRTVVVNTTRQQQRWQR